MTLSPNEHLLAIQRSVDRMDERLQYVRLDRNERVSPFSADVFAEMAASLGPDLFCTYPNPAPLYQRLSRDLSLPGEQLYVTNGSDAAIRMLFHTYVRPADEVVFPDPTYAMYAVYAQIFQARAQLVPYSADRRLDLDQVFRLLERRPRLLALPNPDQPTGAVLPESTLRQLALASQSAGALFVIDEAYYPFYPQTALNLVREFDHVAVTRTFSKVGGLAGLRVGYLAAHASIVNNIQRIRGAYEVNAVAITVGSYILDHPVLGVSYLAEVEAGRKVLAEAAHELGLGFPSCPTNFQLLEFPSTYDPASVVSALKDKGYLVRGPFSAPSVRQCIRVTLGGPEIMRDFANAVRLVVAELRPAPAGVKRPA
jgi:histidinol-phosphate aminotransferase